MTRPWPTGTTGLSVTFVVLLTAWPAGFQSRDVARAVRPVPAGTAALAGVVVSGDESARPLRRVTVTAQSSTSPGLASETVTDDQGRFVIPDLPAGRYIVSAAKGAYLPAAFGGRAQTGPNSVLAGTAIAIADGDLVDDIVIAMSRGAVITGVIRDEAGQPAAGVGVSVMYYTRSPTTGERSLTSHTSRGLTDDRGRYRTFGLPPGEYVVAAFGGASSLTDLHPTTEADVRWARDMVRRAGSAAMPGFENPVDMASRQAMGFVPTFYPGTAVPAEAIAIRLEPGEERTGVDFQTRLIATTRVIGTVTTADGQAVDGAMVRAFGDGSAPTTGSSATTDAAGAFTLTGLSPGRHFVAAQTRPGATTGGSAPSSPPLLAISEVSAHGREVHVNLTLQPGATVSGRLQFDGRSTEPPADPARIRVSLVPEPGTGIPLPGGPSARPDAEGRFVINGVPPGQYRLTATIGGSRTGGGAWTVTKASIDGRDAFESPIAILPAEPLTDALVTLADHGTELTGRMFDATGAPAPEYFIIVFSTDPAFWTVRSRRIEQTRPDRDGTFTFRMLPPGEYLLAAVTEIEQGQWFDPEFLTQLAAASIRISLSASQRTVQDIRVR